MNFFMGPEQIGGSLVDRNVSVGLFKNVVVVVVAFPVRG